MKKQLGISIYPEIVGKEETIKYIDLAKKYGFKRIFANLLELKDDEEGRAKLQMLKEVYTYATDNGFSLIVDVNPNFYKDFKLPPTEIEFFKNLNVSGIRLDEDFQGEVESVLTNNPYNLKVELNASGGSTTVDLTLEKGGNPDNLIACHNFYPMRYTALARDRFIDLSSHYKAKGVRVAAFVTLPEEQKGVGPWNVNEGMPSIEEHRDMPLLDQVVDLLVTNVIDDIILSQQGATEEQFKAIYDLLVEYEQLQTNENIELEVELLDGVCEVEKDIMFNNKGKNHGNRPDFNSYMVRSTFPRIDYKEETIKPFNSGKQLKRGDVVVLNENLGRYKGELHVIEKPIDDSPLKARNLVGKIVEKDLWKLEFIKHPKTWSLKLKK